MNRLSMMSVGNVKTNASTLVGLSVSLGLEAHRSMNGLCMMSVGSVKTNTSTLVGLSVSLGLEAYQSASLYTNGAEEGRDTLMGGTNGVEGGADLLVS